MKKKWKRPRGKANKPADDHEFKAPEYARREFITPEVQRAARKFMRDSYEIESKMIQSRGW